MRPSSELKMNGISDKDVNLFFEYEDYDIHRLLLMDINELPNRENIHVLGPVDNTLGNQLETILISQKDRQRPYKLLIPYNQGANHWVGIYISVDKDGRAEAEYCDSLNKHTEFMQIRAVLAKEYLDITVKVTTRLVQDGRPSCGPLTVENLLLAVKGHQEKREQPNEQSLRDIRKNHILKMLEYGDKTQFFERQRDNRSTVASMTAQLAYLKNMAKNGLSVHELERVAQLISCLNSLSEIRKDQIVMAFSEQIESHKEYLDNIRRVISTMVSSLGGDAESKNDIVTITKLISIMFGVKLQELPKDIKNFLEGRSFLITYNELLEVGKVKNELNVVEPNYLIAKCKQIEKDRELALQLLQSELAKNVKTVEHIEAPAEQMQDTIAEVDIPDRKFQEMLTNNIAIITIAIGTLFAFSSGVINVRGWSIAALTLGLALGGIGLLPRIGVSLLETKDMRDKEDKSKIEIKRLLARLNEPVDKVDKKYELDENYKTKWVSLIAKLLAVILGYTSAAVVAGLLEAEKYSDVKKTNAYILERSFLTGAAIVTMAVLAVLSTSLDYKTQKRQAALDDLEKELKARLAELNKQRLVHQAGAKIFRQLNVPLERQEKVSAEVDDELIAEGKIKASILVVKEAAKKTTTAGASSTAANISADNDKEKANKNDIESGGKNLRL